MEIEIELDGAGNRTVDNQARGTVPAPPVAFVRVLGEESDVVPLADDDDGDFRRGPYTGAGSYQGMNIQIGAAQNIVY